MTYAHGQSDRTSILQRYLLMSTTAYAANRAEHEAPAMVAYPRLNKDHEKKAQKHQFWVTYPMASKVSPRNGFGKYGGLM